MRPTSPHHAQRIFFRHRQHAPYLSTHSSPDFIILSDGRTSYLTYKIYIVILFRHPKFERLKMPSTFLKIENALKRANGEF